MVNPSLPHFLISLEKSMSEPFLPCLLQTPARRFRPPEPSSCRFPQLNTFGRLGPCTPFQAFLTQRLPLASAASSPGPLRSLSSPPPSGPPPALVLRHGMTSGAREGGGAPPLPSQRLPLQLA